MRKKNCDEDESETDLLSCSENQITLSNIERLLGEEIITQYNKSFAVPEVVNCDLPKIDAYIVWSYFKNLADNENMELKKCGNHENNTVFDTSILTEELVAREADESIATDSILKVQYEM